VVASWSDPLSTQDVEGYYTQILEKQKIWVQGTLDKTSEIASAKPWGAMWSALLWHGTEASAL
jgi:hypothetical protein